MAEFQQELILTFKNATEDQVYNIATSLIEGEIVKPADVVCDDNHIAISARDTSKIIDFLSAHADTIPQPQLTFVPLDQVLT